MESSTIYGLPRQRVMYLMKIEHARSRDKAWQLFVCILCIWIKNTFHQACTDMVQSQLQIGTFAFTMHITSHWGHRYCVEQTMWGSPWSPRDLLSGPLQLLCNKCACPIEMHVSRLRLILSDFVASLVFLDTRRGSNIQSSVLYNGDQIMLLFLVSRGKIHVS